MKLECPYCWQHYEIDNSERKQTFTCICCGQTFNGKDALVLPEYRTGMTRWIMILALISVVVLTAFNLFCCFQNWQSGRCSLGNEIDELKQRVAQLESKNVQTTESEHGK